MPNACQKSLESATPARKKRTKNYFSGGRYFNDGKKKVWRTEAKDVLPFRVFWTSRDVRDLFNASGHKLPKSPNIIKLIVLNFGMALKMKIMRELSQLKKINHRLTETFDEWATMNKRYVNVSVQTFLNGNSVFFFFH